MNDNVEPLFPNKVRLDGIRKTTGEPADFSQLGLEAASWPFCTGSRRVSVKVLQEMREELEIIASAHQSIATLAQVSAKRLADIINDDTPGGESA